MATQGSSSKIRNEVSAKAYLLLNRKYEQDFMRKDVSGVHEVHCHKSPFLLCFHF